MRTLNNYRLSSFNFLLHSRRALVLTSAVAAVLVVSTGPDRHAFAKLSFQGATSLARTDSPGPRRIFVRSTSLLVRAAVVEDKLLQRPEFKQLGFALTRDAAEADFIVELRHDLFTKYVYSVVEVRTQTVVASGKVSSLGGTVGGKVAKRFVQDMARVSAP